MKTQFSEAFSGVAATLSPVTTAFTQISSAINAIGGAAWSSFIASLKAIDASALNALGQAFTVLNGLIGGVIASAVQFIAEIKGIPASVNSAIHLIVSGLDDLESAVGYIAGLVSKTVTETINVIFGSLPTPSMPGSPGNPILGVHQGGAPIYQEGLYYLHMNEVVQSAGQASARTAPQAGAPITLNNQTNLRVDGQVISSISEKHSIIRRTTGSAYKWS